MRQRKIQVPPACKQRIAGTLQDFDFQSVGLGVEGATFQLQSDPERGSSSHHQSRSAAEALGPVPLEVF